MNDDGGPFNRPRTIGGLILIGVVAVAVLVDVFSLDYAPDPVVLTLLLSTGALLLGVELAGRVLGGK